MASPRKRPKLSQRNTPVISSTPTRPTHSISPLELAISSISSNDSEKENVVKRPQMLFFGEMARSTSNNSSRADSSISTITTATSADGEDNQPSSSSSSRADSPKSATTTATSVTSFVDYIGEDYDKYFANLGRISYTGLIWARYKPINENSLYGQIVENPKEVHVVAAQWMVDYKTDRTNRGHAIKNLIQFCIDVAGFQKFNVFHNYNMSDFRKSSQTIINKIKEEQLHKHDVIMAGKYLLRERNVTLAKTLRMGIYNFLQKLIELAHYENVLYDETFTAHFLEFIKAMQGTDVTSMRHTGAIIGVKVLTAIILQYHEVINNSSDAESTGESQADILNRKLAFNPLINCLYIIFQKNCCLQNDVFRQMRIECTEEAKIWIKYFPKLFISDYRIVELIMKNITEASKELRMASLCAIEDIFIIPQVPKILNPFLKEITEKVAGRFFDIDIKVAQKAINIFTVILRCTSYISEKHFMKMGNLIFDKNAVIGKAASQSLTNYFRMTAQSPEELLFLIYEMYSHSVNIQPYAKELLVESFLHVCEDMRDWKTFCAMIMSKNMDNQIKTGLAELFSESVYQYVTGKTDVPREMSQEKVNEVDTKEFENIAELFPVLYKILRQQKDPKILTEILRIIPLVNSQYLKRNYCKEYDDIAKATLAIFDFNNADEALIRNVAKVIFYLCSVPDFAKRAEKISKAMCQDIVEDLQKYIENPTAHGTLRIKRVAAFYEHFNLNDKLTFEQLKAQIEAETNDEQYVLGLFDCCRWYLMWELRDLIENFRGVQQEAFDKMMVRIKQNRNIFWSITFILLENEENEKKFLIEVFIIFYDFCIAFDNELVPAIKLNRSFKMLELKIKNAEIHTVLLKFFEKNVISNKDMPLDERRTNVRRYVDLIQINVITIGNIANIFKYYHEYYEEYGSIIDQCLVLYAENCIDHSVYTTVVYTLLFVYEDILKKYSVIDIRTDEVARLKLLSKRFHSNITIKQYSTKIDGNVYKLFYYLFKGAFKHASRVNFLYFVKPFLALINNEETYRKIYNNFRNLIPEDLVKENAVLWLGDAFKQMESKIAMPPPKPIKEKKKGKKDKIKSTMTKKGVDDGKTSESEEDDMTIHDSESDDWEESFSSLNIRNDEN